MTFLLDQSVSRYRRPLKIWDFVSEIKYWDLRTLNNVKSNFSFKKINKKKTDFPAIYSTVFRCLLVVLLFFFWFYCITTVTVTPFIRRSQGWSPGSGKALDQSQQKCSFFTEIQFCCKFFQLQPKRENSFSSLRGKIEPFVKLNHLCRTSRHGWLSFSACNRCCAYHLICIMTISTYTTGARAHFFTVQEPSKRVICALAPVAAVNFLKGKEFYENSRQSYWILKKVKFFNCLSSIINRFKLIGFTSNWLIRLTWQLRCLQTEQKSQQSLIFSSRAYALVYRGSRACVSLAITL